MTTNEIISALALPPQARIDQRVPKKHLIDHGAVTATDKKSISEGVEELLWVAALKPSTVGVPAYEDAERQYLEIAVLTLALRDGAKAGRLRELVHRAIPYPVVLIATDADGLVLSLCELRHAQNEAGKMVLDGEVQAARVPDNAIGEAFRESLAISRLPNADLRQLYRGWMDRLTTLEAGSILGQWPGEREPGERRNAVQVIRRIDAELADLRRLAKDETQLARRVELNLDIKRRSAERTRLLALLG